MSQSDDKARVLIVLTEVSPVLAIWQVALQALRERRAELTALLLADDRWQRAASLPFTREISTLGGTVSDFTVQRADQIMQETIERIRQRIERLATEADQALHFELLPEADQDRLRRLVGEPTDVLIASSEITVNPIYATLERLECRIMLVGSAEEEPEDDRPSA